LREGKVIMGWSLLSAGTWSSPETTGPRPPPCAAFSFAKIDLSRAVMFGGRQRHQRVNEVHILDVKSWVSKLWSNIIDSIIFCRFSLLLLLYSFCCFWSPVVPQHWSGAILPTSPADLWPQERSLHSACTLVDPKFYSMTADSFRSTPHSPSCNGPSDLCTGRPQPKLFVLWGTGNSDVELAQDAWVLDVNNTTWSPVITCML